jgi:hypothetical protein
MEILTTWLILLGSLLLHVPLSFMFSNATYRFELKTRDDRTNREISQRNIEALKELSRQYRTGQLNHEFSLEDMTAMRTMYDEALRYLPQQSSYPDVRTELHRVLNLAERKSHNGKADPKTVELFCLVLLGNLLAPRTQSMRRTKKAIPQNIYLNSLLTLEQVRLGRKNGTIMDGVEAAWN